MKYAQRCKQCQQHADWHHALLEELQSIHNPWPFHTWGIDILGLFPLAVHQMKYLVVAIMDRSRACSTDHNSQGLTLCVKEHSLSFWNPKAFSV